MGPTITFDSFKRLFPDFIVKYPFITYSRVGKTSIAIFAKETSKQKGTKDFIFCYNNDNDFAFGSYQQLKNSFIKEKS